MQDVSPAAPPRPAGRYRRVWARLPAYRTPILLGTLAVVASRLLMVRAPLELGAALEALALPTGADLAAMRGAAWRFLGFVAATGLMTFFMRRLLVGTSRRVERDLKREIFAHLERLPASWFDRHRTGDLISRLTSDVEAVRWFFGPGFMYVGGTIVLVPMVLWSMASIAPQLTLIALIPLAGILWVVRGIAPRIMKHTRAVQGRLGELSARAQESFAGARVVRAYATQPREIEAFGRENEALVQETLGLARARAWMQGGIYVLGGAAELVVLVHGGLQVMDGTMTLGDLVPLLSYVGLLIWPLISVGWVVSAIQRAAAAMARINEVLDTPPEPRGENPPDAPPAAGRLALRHVRYAYPGTTRLALDDVSVEVPAGGTLAVVGPVASGKTTLLRLLCRLYEPDADQVFLDGADVTSRPLAEVRRAFSVVPQDAFLFSTTLRANLGYAQDDPLGEDDAARLLRTAGLEQDVAGFSQGLETVVGERGLMLSGGQKQRATLARALHRDAPVLLLDDCLSAVDTQTEARILDRLREVLRTRTTVIVAQRLSSIRDADHILVLDAGRVVAQGDHATLQAAEGWYARTWERQRLEAAVEEAS